MEIPPATTTPLMVVSVSELEVLANVPASRISAPTAEIAKLQRNQVSRLAEAMRKDAQRVVRVTLDGNEGGLRAGGVFHRGPFRQASPPPTHPPTPRTPYARGPHSGAT